MVIKAISDNLDLILLLNDNVIVLTNCLIDPMMEIEEL